MVAIIEGDGLAEADHQEVGGDFAADFFRGLGVESERETSVRNQQTWTFRREDMAGRLTVWSTADRESIIAKITTATTQDTADEIAAYSLRATTTCPASAQLVLGRRVSGPH